jgi:hypothetical protein
MLRACQRFQLYVGQGKNFMHAPADRLKVFSDYVTMRCPVFLTTLVHQREQKCDDRSRRRNYGSEQSGF